MINLSEYQQIFEIENTAERCKKVKDTMEQLWKSEFEVLANELLGQDYLIGTYGKSLSQAQTDSLNPKYAEQMKDTSMGKRYFAQIVRKIGEKENSLLTLEFNGVEKQLYVSTELSFYQVHELIKSGRLKSLLKELAPSIRTFTRTGAFTRSEVERSILEQTLVDMIKPRTRPWIYFGLAIPLEGQFEVAEIMDLLRQTWEQTTELRNYVLEDRAQSASAAHIMKLLSSVDTPSTVSIFGNSYQIHYEVVENEKSGTRQQEFTLKREGQTIVQGCFYYSEYEVRSGSSRPMLAVDVEKHAAIKR